MFSRINSFFSDCLLCTYIRFRFEYIGSTLHQDTRVDLKIQRYISAATPARPIFPLSMKRVDLLLDNPFHPIP